MKFEKNFLIGAATAAHQVEGNNVNSDYWAQEHMEFTSFNEPSGDACDHYHRYEEDIRLLAEAGLNAYRFSIEWARIEPEPGTFDEKEVEHYRQVIRCCRENGVEPVVTMHHFTSPKWLIEQGGWEAEETVEKFARYCGYVAEKLGDELRYVCTINEANMGLQMAAIAKRYMILMQKGVNAESSVQVGVNMENPMLARMKKQVEKSYTYPGYVGEKIEAHVYACGDEVELLLDGHLLGRKSCTKEEEYQAVFAFPYQPGHLEAVAYRGGVEIGRDCLETAGAVAGLRLTGERKKFVADSEELDFVLIEAVDENGNQISTECGEITVAVENGVLLALGSGDPKPDRSALYTGVSCPLYGGKAMAVVQAGEKSGSMRLTARMGGHTAEIIWDVVSESTTAGVVHEVLPSVLDLPLGTLLENEQARVVLSKHLGALLDNPMLNQVKAMSLKKLLSMGGSVPEGLEDALAFLQKASGR